MKTAYSSIIVVLLFVGLILLLVERPTIDGDSQNFIVTFRVIDGKSLQPIEGANVGFDDPERIPHQTNQYGIVSIRIEKGQHQWFVGKVGYSKPTDTINVQSDTELTIRLRSVFD